MPVLADMGCTVAKRFIERAGLAALRLPTHPGQVGAGRIGRQIGNTHQMNAWRSRNLGQIHRAEFAGSDQPNADGIALGSALQKLGVQAHDQAVTVISSSEVSRALCGMPSFQGRSTG